MCCSLCFYFIDSGHSFDYFLVFTLLGVLLLCSRVFRCTAQLLVYDLSHGFKKPLIAMNFPLSTCKHSFHWIIGNRPYLYFCLTCFSFSRKLFSFYALVSFVLILLLLVSRFNSWWSDRVDSIISIFLYLLRLTLCLRMWSIFEESSMRYWEKGDVLCFRVK